MPVLSVPWHRAAPHGCNFAKLRVLDGFADARCVLRDGMPSWVLRSRIAVTVLGPHPDSCPPESSPWRRTGCMLGRVRGRKQGRPSSKQSGEDKWKRPTRPTTILLIVHGLQAESGRDARVGDIQAASDQQESRIRKGVTLSRQCCSWRGIRKPGLCKRVTS